jgi:hypothetical protein
MSRRGWFIILGSIPAFAFYLATYGIGYMVGRNHGHTKVVVVSAPAGPPHTPGAETVTTGPPTIGSQASRTTGVSTTSPTSTTIALPQPSTEALQAAVLVPNDATELTSLSPNDDPSIVLQGGISGTLSMCDNITVPRSGFIANSGSRSYIDTSFAPRSGLGTDVAGFFQAGASNLMARIRTAAASECNGKVVVRPPPVVGDDTIAITWDKPESYGGAVLHIDEVFFRVSNVVAEVATMTGLGDHETLVNTLALVCLQRVQKAMH